MDFQRVDVRLYSADKATYYVVPKRRFQRGYTIAEAAGGYTEASFTLIGHPEDFNNLVRRRMLEVWATFKDTGPHSSRALTYTLLWRGYIAEVNEVAPLASAREAPKVEVRATGFYRMVAAQVRVDKAFAFSGLDRAAVFADLCSRYVAAEHSGIQWLATPLGDNLATFDARRTLFGEAVEKLVSGMGLVCYGADVATTSGGVRVDNLHLKPVEAESAVKHILPATGSVRSKLLRSDLDAGRQVTALQFNGGAVRFPNRLAPAVSGNTGFESPATGSESAFNQLEDPSFEEYTGSTPDIWTFSGASRKSSGLSEGHPHHGEWMVEVDAVGEYAEVAFVPDDPLVEEDTWTFGLYARQAEAVGSGSEGTITVKIGFLDGSDVLIGAYSTATYTPPINLWTGGYQVSRAVPASAVKVKVRVEMATNPAGCLGVVIDSAYLYNATQVYQLGWDTSTTGTGAISAIDWAYEGEAHAGAYSVYLSVTASDDDDNSVYFFAAGSRESKRIEAFGNESVRWSVRVASVDGGTTGLPKVRLFLICYDADGGAIYPSGHFTEDFAANATPGADWLEYSLEETLPEETAYFTVSVNIRGTGKLLIDSAGVFSANAPAGYWVESDRYRAEIRVADLFASGEIRDEADAIGDVWESVDSDLVVDTDTASDLAEAIFTARTLPVRQPEIQVHGIVNTGSGKVSAEAMPGERMKALGERASELVPDPMVIAEVRHEIEGGKLVSRFLGNRVRRDWTVQVMEALLRRLRLTGAAGRESFSSAGAAFAIPAGAAAHTHPHTDITDWSEALQDAVAAMLTEGAGISLTYDDGAGTLTIDAAGGAAVTEYTSAGSNTYDIPASATYLAIQAVAAGGGGGSGRRGAAASDRFGGGGASGGCHSRRLIPIASLGGATQLTVVLGAAGGGGAARTSDNTDGAAGSAASATTITLTDGSLAGLRLLDVQGGAAGSGGTTTTGSAGSSVTRGEFASGTGANGSVSGTPSAATTTQYGTGGGGGGGGISSGDTARAGGSAGRGGNAMDSTLTAPAGGANTGGNGTAATAYASMPGHGGGGGGANLSGAGGTGGAGARGGGGGGGGASVNGSNSGAGGDGGAPYVCIVAW